MMNDLKTNVVEFFKDEFGLIFRGVSPKKIILASNIKIKNIPDYGLAEIFVDNKKIVVFSLS